MQTFTICSYKYGIDVSEPLICRAGELSVERVNDCCARICCDDIKELASLVCEVILTDLSQFEIADMINELPFELEQKKRILISAVGYSRRAALRIPVRRALFEYFSQSNRLVLEGFITFRMQDTVELWERCVEKAAEDIFLAEEKAELIQILCSLLPRDDIHVLLIVNPDCSLTLIDETGIQTDYPRGSEESIMGALIAISPAEIMLCDMSDGVMHEFIRALNSAFPKKVRPVEQ